MLKKFFLWLVYSSSDAEKISLTIKGFLMSILPILIIFLPHTDVPTLIDSVVSIVQTVLGIISGVMVVYGTIRKIVTTIQGTNAVVLGFQD